VSNVPFEDPAISDNWISIKSYKEEHYKRYNYYTFQIAANPGDQNRTATITFASAKYHTSKVVTIHQSKKIPATGETSGHAWVNLALPSGTLWATMNVGASKPEGYGSYFAWGETVIMGEEDKDNAYNYKHYSTYLKENYSSYSYKFYHDEENHTNVLHKYFKSDGLLVLESKDDAASIRWSTDWTIPTFEHVQELINNTRYEWTSNYSGSSIAGAIFYRLKSGSEPTCSTADLHIIIPASGYAEWKKYESVGDFVQVWTKSVQSPKSASNPYYDVWTLFCNTRDKEWRSSSRAQGLCVRPVLGN